MNSAEFSYAIDEHDRLVEASPAYFEFAAENRWPGAGASIGEPLWDFVTGKTMRRVQQSLVRRVRESGRAVELPFRCDSPGVRREMRIAIEPEPGGRVNFMARPISERPRQPQPLLDPVAPRSEGTIDMCGWCDRFLADGEWVEVEVAAAQLGLTTATTLPAISHGICPDCDGMLFSA